VGNKARELEDAAKEGNYDFVKSQNPLFIKLMESFIRAINKLLEEIDAKTDTAVKKVVKPAPDPELLAAILKASRDYDMDTLDRTIVKLEQYSYESEGELVEWLQEQIGKSAFEEIEKRLANRSG
jgi:hypothetical protein